jgi:hypothetical protein
LFRPSQSRVPITPHTKIIPQTIIENSGSVKRIV